MSTRKYAREKVDLGLVLAIIAVGTDMGSGELVFRLAQQLGCSDRAVKDAIAVLHRSGYARVERDESDRRRHRFRVTERGRRVVSDPYGWPILRLARRLFTTCPSPTVGAFQRVLSDPEREERLKHAEAILLGVDGG